MSEKIVLVTGGTGLVGKALQMVIDEERKKGELKNEKWIFVSTRDANLCDKVETDQMFQKYKPTHVVHLAALMGGMGYIMSHNLDFFSKNIVINDNVLDASFRYDVAKVVSIMSTCVFPDKTTYPIDETMIHNGPPHPSIFGYSQAKRMVDVSNKAYFEQHGRLFTSVIPCNMYGPFDNFDLKNSNVIPGLIRKLYEAKERGDKTYTVFGSGKAMRQFMFSIDMAKLVIWTLREYDTIEPIILSVDEEDEVSIAEAARVIKEAVGFEGELVFDTTKPDGQIKKTASNKRLRSYLPDFKFTDFKNAIQETANWYKENRNVARN